MLERARRAAARLAARVDDERTAPGRTTTPTTAVEAAGTSPRRRRERAGGVKENQKPRRLTFANAREGTTPERGFGETTTAPGQTEGCGDDGDDGERDVEARDETGGREDGEARAAEVEALERALREETRSLREALEEAERRAKASAATVVELEERVRELREENVGEARVLRRMETQLRRREQEFASRRELLSAQLEAAIFSANERDNEALMRNQEARKEVRAAKRAAADYVLNDAQRREFSLKAGWCARYYHLFIALGLGPVDEDVREEASVWTESFGITPGEGETHESIVKRIDAVFVEAAKRPVASYEVETSLVPSPSDLDDDGGEPAPESEPVDSAKTSLPTSLNPSWPTNFRHAVSVEIAMRHLVAARIEQRVVVALADTRRANVLARLRRSTTTSSTDDSSALSDDEMNEFHFRRAWLRLMWARAREAGIDLGIADEREDHWLARMKVMTSPEMKDPSHFKRDALAIDKGLKELRSTLVESRLWRQV